LAVEVTLFRVELKISRDKSMVGSLQVRVKVFPLDQRIVGGSVECFGHCFRLTFNRNAIRNAFICQCQPFEPIFSNTILHMEQTRNARAFPETDTALDSLTLICSDCNANIMTMAFDSDAIIIHIIRRLRIQFGTVDRKLRFVRRS
jgi:hypothetical protein